MDRTFEQRYREHQEILLELSERKRIRERPELATNLEITDEELAELGITFNIQPKQRPEDFLCAADFADKSQCPFTRNNSSGYQININHPAIRPVFEQYVKEECRHIPPISDHERIYFEMRIIHKLDSLHIFKDDYAPKLTDAQIREMKYKSIRERERNW